jgi:hypothetical protein
MFMMFFSYSATEHLLFLRSLDHHNDNKLSRIHQTFEVVLGYSYIIAAGTGSGPGYLYTPASSHID